MIVLNVMDMFGFPIIGGLFLLLIGFVYIMIGGVLRNKKEQ